jgi:hypothetical protein
MPKSNSQHFTNECIKNETKKYVKHFDKLILKAISKCINRDMDMFLEAWDIVVSTCSFSVL